jgi:antitoxin MazE
LISSSLDLLNLKWVKHQRWASSDSTLVLSGSGPDKVWMRHAWLFILRLNKELTMTEAILSIKHWGNSLGVRLPQAVARAANLHADQQVRMVVEDGRVIIEPLPQAGTVSLEERLKRFDPARHGGEAMAVAPMGAERW